MVRVVDPNFAGIQSAPWEEYVDNLTEIEIEAIDSPINLSDGHPRQDLTGAQEKIIGRLPELFEIARTEPLEDLERRAHEAFFSALGQHSAPIADGRVYSVYSSSVATMALAAVLAELDHTHIHSLAPGFPRVAAMPPIGTAL